MTSHDLPIEEIRRLLDADKNRHVCVFDHRYYPAQVGSTFVGRCWRYCKCGKWEPDAQ